MRVIAEGRGGQQLQDARMLGVGEREGPRGPPLGVGASAAPSAPVQPEERAGVRLIAAAKLLERREVRAQLLQARRALLLMRVARGGQAVCGAPSGVFARFLRQARVQVVKHKDRHALGCTQALCHVAEAGQVAAGVGAVAIKEALREERRVAA